MFNFKILCNMFKTDNDFRGPYSFACQPETWSPGVHAEQFRCQSKHTSGGPIVVTRTDFKKNTLNVGTRTRSTNEHLFALAMMYTTPVCLHLTSFAIPGDLLIDESRPRHQLALQSQQPRRQIVQFQNRLHKQTPKQVHRISVQERRQVLELV